MRYQAVWHGHVVTDAKAIDVERAVQVANAETIESAFVVIYVDERLVAVVSTCLDMQLAWHKYVEALGDTLTNIGFTAIVPITLIGA